MHLILQLTSLFLPNALPQSLITGRGNSFTITQICHLNGDTCTTVANVTIGQGLVIGAAGEGTPPALTITDPCSDTWHNGISAGGGTAGVIAYWTTATCNFNTGSSIVTTGSGWTGGPTLVYSLVPFSAGSPQDQDTSSTPSSTASWSAGPTSAQTGSGVCVAFAMGDSTPTFTHGTSWIDGPGTNNISNGDGRTLYGEYQTFTASATVTATATSSPGNSGGFVVKCLQQQ